MAKTRARGAHAAREAVLGTAEPQRFPAWLAPLLYAVATVVLFREFVFFGAGLLGTDTMALSYFARSFYTEFVRGAGHFPLWDPLLFGGLPFVEGMHGDIFYPPSLALFFLDARAMWGWKMVLHVFLAGVFAYLWLRGLGLRRESAFFGGLVYMLGADLVSLVFPGGDGKLFVSTLAPLEFWLVERAVRNRRLSDFAFLALGISVMVFTSHMQLAYFAVWGISLYFFFRLWQVWRETRRGGEVARLFGLFVLSGVLGVGAAAVQFVPPLLYLREWSHRAEKTVEAEGQTAYEYSTTWSLHPEELAALVVPEFVGQNVPRETEPANTYWGRNPFKLNHEYLGFIPLLLIPLLLLRRREARTWFFLGLGALALLYALGATTPVFRLFYLIPGVSLFRAPSLIIFLAGLSVATLAALALERYLGWATGDDAEQRAARRYLWIAAGVTGVLALLASSGAVVGIWQAVFYPDMPAGKAAALEANLPAIRQGFWIVFLLAALVAATWEGLARRLYGWRSALALVAVLVFVDLARVDRLFIRATVLMNEQADPVLFRPDDTLAFLQRQAAEEPPFRVFDIGPFLGGGTYPQNAAAIHGLEQLAGHHGNEIGRYRELIGGEQAVNVVTSELRLLDLLNARYVVSPQEIQAPGLVEVHRGYRAIAYRNETALPRAFLVGRVEVVADEAAVERLLAPAFDYRTTALLPEPLPAGVEVQPDPRGRIEWVDPASPPRTRANEYTLRVQTDRPALLVITDNYFDAFAAEVNGREAPLLRADYTFRAVPVPAGEHTVRIFYRSEVLRASVLASAGLLLLLLGIGLAGAWRRLPGAPPEP